MSFKILSIFERLEVFHLNKDVVKLPESIAYVENGECEIIYSNKVNIKNTGKVKFSNVLDNNCSIGLFSFKIAKEVIKKARTSDLLFLIHLRYYNLLYAVLYKLSNPKGKVYIKMDHGEIQMKQNGVFYGNKCKVIFEKLLFRIAHRIISIISSETEDGKKETINQLKFERVLKVPNCIDAELSAIPNSPQRKNRFLAIGRLGDKNKNFAFIVECLKRTNLNDWVVEFIGEYDDLFKKRIDTLLMIRPDLKKNIILSGAIWDRNKLYRKMLSSRCLLLSSKHEGSPLVFSEAVTAGLIICTTNVSGANEYASDFGFISEQGDDVTFIKNVEKICSSNTGELDELHRKTMNKYEDLMWEKKAKYVMNKIDKLCDA